MKTKILSQALKEKKWAVDFMTLGDDGKELTRDQLFISKYIPKDDNKYTFIFVNAGLLTKTPSMGQNEEYMMFIFGKSVDYGRYFVTCYGNKGQIDIKDAQQRYSFTQIPFKLGHDEREVPKKDSSLWLIMVIIHLVKRYNKISKQSLQDFELPSQEEIKKIRMEWANRIGERLWGNWEAGSWLDEHPRDIRDLTEDEMIYALNNIEL